MTSYPSALTRFFGTIPPDVDQGSSNNTMLNLLQVEKFWEKSSSENTRIIAGRRNVERPSAREGMPAPRPARPSPELERVRLAPRASPVPSPGRPGPPRLGHDQPLSGSGEGADKAISTRRGLASTLLRCHVKPLLGYSWARLGYWRPLSGAGRAKQGSSKRRYRQELTNGQVKGAVRDRTENGINLTAAGA